MECQSPMSHSKFNGSRNVLTLLGVKMTEHDMRQRSHRGPPWHYYHSAGSSVKLTARTTNCWARAGSTISLIVMLIPTLYDITSAWNNFYQWINDRSFRFNELGFLWNSPAALHALNSLTNPHNPTVLLSLSCTPPPALSELGTSARRSQPQPCVCVLWRQMFLNRKQASEFFKCCYLLFSPPLFPSTLSTIHTCSGLMHCIKVATCGGCEYIGCITPWKPHWRGQALHNE